MLSNNLSDFGMRFPRKTQPDNVLIHHFVEADLAKKLAIIINSSIKLIVLQTNTTAKELQLY